MVKTTQILLAVAAAIIAVPTDASSAVSRTLERRHVSLAEPRPYKGTGYGPTNPLDTDGSNYPCKAPGGDGSKLIIDGAPTTVIIGEPQTVSFDGHAVHGGGSCQFGLTEGFAPTKNSVFKVIQSIEGGCPKANQPGNLEAGQKADTFSFTVPADFAPGDYTFGWIWINRIGGAPEIYMNCAPITVKAGKGSSTSTRRSKDRRVIAGMSKRQTGPKYPDFFLANLGSLTGGCDTNDALRQQVPISYPNPGSNVLRPEGTSKLLAQKCDGNPHNKGAAPPAKPSGTATASSGAGPTSTATPTTQSSAATTAAPTSTPTRATSSSATTTTVVSTSAPASSAPTTATRATSGSATTTAVPTSATSTRATSSSTPTKPTAPSTATPKPTTSPACGCHSAKPTPASSTTTTTPAKPTSRPPTPANPQTPPGSCTDGHLMCVETVMFSTCTGGRWIEPQPLADNTVCVLEGEAVGLKLTVLW